MNLELLSDRYFIRRGSPDIETYEDLEDVARAIWSQVTPDQICWLIEGLADTRTKCFVAFVLQAIRPMPENFYTPMMWAAIDEPDPSDNNRFIAPCIQTFGYRRVNETLLDILESGTDWDKAGAASALYWANVPYIASLPADPTPADVAEKEELDAIRDDMADVFRRKRRLMLNTFVSSTNVDVQRRLIGQLDLDVQDNPADLRPLIERAIQIGHSHPDEYICHRTAIQLGTERTFRSLPPRTAQEFHR